MGADLPNSPSSIPCADASDEDVEEERPTLIPAFDLEELARQARPSDPTIDTEEEMPTVIPPPDHQGFRAAMATLTDDAELEAARLASVSVSSLPPHTAAPVVGRWSIPPGRPKYVHEEPELEIVAGDDDASILDPLDEARLLAEAGDEAGAFALVEGLLRNEPSNAAARKLAEECHKVIVAQYTARLGSLARVPRIAVTQDHLVTLTLDHRVGFLLALVDGMSDIETILDMSGMSAPDALRALVELYESGVIAFRA